MALPTLVQAALDRLATLYNGGIWAPAATSTGPANPGGLDGDGHAVNFVPALRDVATAGKGIVAAVDAAVVQAEKAASDAGAAAILIQGGPVSSVQIGDGPRQVGAVRINLDSLSAQIEEQIEEVQAAQASLAATQATIQSKSAAYALAFGG